MFHVISKQEISSAADLVSLFHLETGASNPEVDEQKLIEVIDKFFNNIILSIIIL